MKIGSCTAGNDALVEINLEVLRDWSKVTDEDRMDLASFVEELSNDKVAREGAKEPICVVCGTGHCVSHPDECMGFLPGVVAACCGHGDIERAHCVLRISEGVTLQLGQDKAMSYMRSVVPSVGIKSIS